VYDSSETKPSPRKRLRGAVPEDPS
jgi:hypothetical protein